jgi:hypothetical protein
MAIKASVLCGFCFSSFQMKTWKVDSATTCPRRIKCKYLSIVEWWTSPMGWERGAISHSHSQTPSLVPFKVQFIAIEVFPIGRPGRPVEMWMGWMSLWPTTMAKLRVVYIKVHILMNKHTTYLMSIFDFLYVSMYVVGRMLHVDMFLNILKSF